MYPYMFSMVMLSLEDINKTFDLEIPEDEAGYLVLHFQASLERLERNKKTKKKTVIVCHMGVGISNLLAAKIEQHFDDVEILSVIGKYDLSGFMEKHSVDFIISTTPLKNVNTPSVVVSPLLERKDKEKLSHFITEISKKTNDDQSFSTLCGLLDDELIFTKVRKEHRFDVIRLLGDSLLGKGKVTEGYTENVLNREEKSATSIGGAIAIPHGNPLMVKTSCVALAVLDEPLEWGHELVSVVFMLALDDDITGLSRKVIGDIANISDHPALVQQLIKAEEPEYIIEILGKQQ